MNKLFEETLEFLNEAVDHFSLQVPLPKQMSFNDSFVFRYQEKTILQAIVQKSARMVASLHSVKVLSDHGLFQDQAAIQRMLDEFQEDIWFLVFGVTNDDVTPLHQEYLNEFYKEEFDNQYSAIKSTQKRGMVSRKKIRAYIAKIEGQELDPSTGIELSRTLNKVYSGFIHGASPQIMDMFGGIPPRYHVSGMLGTPREKEHREDMWNYFYRSILTFGFVAMAFGDQDFFDNLIKFRSYFEKCSGS